MELRMKPGIDIKNTDGFLTYLQDDKEHCLNYLMHFEGKGVFEPSFGKVDVTPEEAKAHNLILDKLLIDGLDANCQIGQGGTFYIRHEGSQFKVVTFLGTLVSDKTERVEHKRTYPTLSFYRNGKKFSGTILKNGPFNFVRIK
jgi:hypothetical protein